MCAWTMSAPYPSWYSNVWLRSKSLLSTWEYERCFHFGVWVFFFLCCLLSYKSHLVEVPFELHVQALFPTPHSHELWVTVSKVLTLKKARVFSSLYLPKCIDMELSLSFIEGIMPGGLSIRFSLQPPQCSKCQCSLGEKQQGLLAEPPPPVPFLTEFSSTCSGAFHGAHSWGMLWEMWAEESGIALVAVKSVCIHLERAIPLLFLFPLPSLLYPLFVSCLLSLNRMLNNYIWKHYKCIFPYTLLCS